MPVRFLVGFAMVPGVAVLDPGQAAKCSDLRYLAGFQHATETFWAELICF